MRSIVITRLFTFFHPLRFIAFKSLSIHQLNDSSTPGVLFPDKAPKRRLKIKKNMCVTNATGGLLVYQVLHSRVKFKHNFDTKG